MDEAHMLMIAFLQGQIDFILNVPFSNCPFSDVQAAQEWSRGWQMAEGKQNAFNPQPKGRG